MVSLWGGGLTCLAMSLAVDLAALPVTVWKAKLASLRSHYVGDEDPRVAECLAGTAASSTVTLRRATH